MDRACSTHVYDGDDDYDVDGISYKKLRSLNLATAYLGILILNEDTRSDVTTGRDNVKWVNMVREDVRGCCDNSKEPSDFVKGEKFLEWLIDCSLLKDNGPWSSCELLKEMRAKPVAYAATGSPRAGSAAVRL